MFGDVNRNYKHIIWDWNGTLLNDVRVAVDTMNRLLKIRNLQLLDIERYKDIFTFPVKDYYAQLGFDFSVDPFEMLATEYISQFNSNKHKFKLHNGVGNVLKAIKNLGVSQSILSASEEKELIEAVSELNINDYFIRIAGLTNHYAVSKVTRGKELIADLKLNPDGVLLIGDTVHDYDVSKELGCDCLLICNGHQSFRRISDCNTSVVKTISDVIDFIGTEAIA